ncbi:hypothetical protein SARC_16391, partial [Sphaeroforma arctica JP610]
IQSTGSLEDNRNESRRHPLSSKSTIAEKMGSDLMEEDELSSNSVISTTTRDGGDGESRKS